MGTNIQNNYYNANNILTNPRSAAAAGRNATQTASRGISGVRSLLDFRVTCVDSVIADDGQRFVMAEGDIAGRTLAVFGDC